MQHSCNLTVNLKNAANNHSAAFCAEVLKFDLVMEEAIKSRIDHRAKYYGHNYVIKEGFYAFLLKFVHKTKNVNFHSSLCTRWITQ